MILFNPAFALVLGACLFAAGAYGVLARRQIIVILMSIEILLGAVGLTLVTLARALADPGGQALVLFAMAVSAAEAAVGLAILVAFSRTFHSTDADAAQTLRG